MATATVKLTKEQKAEAKKLETMHKLALRVKKKFPEITVKYSAYGVTACLGWYWFEDKKLEKLSNRILKLFAGKVEVAADVSGGGVRTAY